MQVLLDAQGDGPAWPGNGRHRDFDAAVITHQSGVLVVRHRSSSPVIRGSGPRTLAPFTAILARLTDRSSYEFAYPADRLPKQSPQSVPLAIGTCMRHRRSILLRGNPRSLAPQSGPDRISTQSPSRCRRSEYGSRAPRRLRAVKPRVLKLTPSRLTPERRNLSRLAEPGNDRGSIAQWALRSLGAEGRGHHQDSSCHAPVSVELFAGVDAVAASGTSPSDDGMFASSSPRLPHTPEPM